MQWSLRMALLSGVVFAALCGPAKADWFSDLTDRIQTNSPAAWEGQNRGRLRPSAQNLAGTPAEHSTAAH
jgi:hypothetical protein